jgi:hypothetical protein
MGPPNFCGIARISSQTTRYALTSEVKKTFTYNLPPQMASNFNRKLGSNFDIICKPVYLSEFSRLTQSDTGFAKSAACTR